MKNNRPFFSIITCTKNSAQYLADCINSLKCQTFHDYEHIVIDGISTDKTISLIPNYSQIFSLKPNGISAAMNEGIKKARGKYIYFLHSDDALHDANVLNRVHSLLAKQSDLDWVYGQILTVSQDGGPIGEFPRHHIFQTANSYLLKFINFIPHQATFVKKEVFAQFGYFSTDLKSCMDYDYWLRISRYTKWTYIPILITKYRLHPHAQSSSRANQTTTYSESYNIQRQYQNNVERLVSKIINNFIYLYNHTMR